MVVSRLAWRAMPLQRWLFQRAAQRDGVRAVQLLLGPVRPAGFPDGTHMLALQRVELHAVVALVRHLD